MGLKNARRSLLFAMTTMLAMVLLCGAALAQEADTTPPETSLDGRPGTFSSNVSPTFYFTSSETNSTFECKLDGADLQSCSSPKQYFLLSQGQHTFQVQAKDASGNVDETPIVYTWEVWTR